ncbi:MAG TPA: hypothetical protein VFB08_11930 [Burkholderiales bacterium]|nr:hypothetical protein [Burkholderiales bacterium]
MKTRLLGMALLALLAGCVTFGPYGTADFEPTLRRDAPMVEGKIVHQVPGRLLYGIDGFNFVDNMAVKSPIFHGGRTESGIGLFVLTEDKVHFVVWRDEKYQHGWDLAYKQIQSLEVRALGLGRRLVVKLDADPGVTSFDIMSDDAQWVDAARTASICRLLAERSGKECRLPA